MIKSFMLKIVYNRFILPHTRWGVIMIKMICKRKVNTHYPVISSTLVVIGKYISSEELMGPIFCALLLLSPSDS